MFPGSGLRYRGQSFGNEPVCGCSSRRDVLAGLGAIGGAAALFPAGARAQATRPPAQTVDIHHHIYPPRYRADNIDRIVKDLMIAPASFYLGWSVERAIEKMDQAGVAAAINSMSTPGVWFDDGEAGRTRARECNEFGARLIGDYPGRFGMFAAIPLPDAEGSLREIDYALDVLKLDGIGLLTSYAGRLLGDPLFAPVFEELNRRKAVVFVHPTMSCCGNLSPGISPPILEYPMDTTRTIASLLLAGTFARCSDIRFVFCHGGGVLASVFNRIIAAVQRMKPDERAVNLPKGPEYELQRQYYDLASVAFNPAAIAALRKLFPTSQFLYGSDEPFNSTVAIAGAVQKLDFSDDDLRAIRRGNALRLFPRLQI